MDEANEVTAVSKADRQLAGRPFSEATPQDLADMVAVALRNRVPSPSRAHT